VFCASLADVFEDNPQLTDWRRELFMLIGQTPNLDWLILTKRPENILGMIPHFVDGLPDNVWIGTSIETQEYLETRLPALLEIPASVHFLSVEPMLGPVRLPIEKLYPWAGVLDWVICGGESGPHARPMELQWARDLRNDCKASGTAFFMKQIGGRADKRDQMTDFPEDLQIREFPQ
jgi:protein gp37